MTRYLLLCLAQERDDFQYFGVYCKVNMKCSYNFPNHQVKIKNVSFFYGILQTNVGHKSENGCFYFLNACTRNKLQHIEGKNVNLNYNLCKLRNGSFDRKKIKHFFMQIKFKPLQSVSMRLLRVFYY